MKMRPLIIDDNAKAEVARVRAHAEANPYRPVASGNVPGDDRRFVAHLGSYRCVFTYTHSDGGVWRHLSVSVPSKNYPNPAACFAIADLFGFTGWDHRTIDRAPDGWLLNISKPEHCVVIAQAVASERPQ
jgi:hypothetical protein